MGKIILVSEETQDIRVKNATVAQLAVQPIRNRQVIGSNPIGGSPKISGFSPESSVFRKEKPLCF
jgi:hypothetical protein